MHANEFNSKLWEKQLNVHDKIPVCGTGESKVMTVTRERI